MNNIINKESIIEYISKIFKNDTNQKFVVINFNDKKDIKNIVEYYKDIVEVSNLSNVAKIDYYLNYYDLINYIQSINKETIVYGISTHLKLQGNEMLYNFFKNLAEDRTFTFHNKIIFITYNLEILLKEIITKNIRCTKNIFFVNDNYIEKELLFSETQIFDKSYLEIKGLHNIGDYEVLDEKCVCITKNIKMLNNDYSLLNYQIYNFDIYKEFYNKFAVDIDKRFDNTELLTKIINIYSKDKFDEKRKEIIDNIATNEEISYLSKSDDLTKYIFLIISHEYLKNNAIDSYFRYAVEDVFGINNIFKRLYIKIKELKYDSESFNKYYNERYELFKNLSNNDLEIISYEYCKTLFDKDDNIIYYLSDLTRLERDKIIECLNKNSISDNKILEILKNNYYNLYCYLNNDKNYNVSKIDAYYIKNYISLYKINKVSNQISEEFINLVDDAALKYKLFEVDTRNRVLSKIGIDKEKDFIVFFDALGIEYINYILCLCDRLKIHSTAYIGRANLPTETEFNKDFLSFTINSTKYNEIDNIVHNEKKDTLDEKNSFPIYINEELQVIDIAIKQIYKNYLLSGNFKNVYIIADHGATRFAKIYQGKKTLDGEVAGKSGGRFVKYDKSLDKIKTVYKASQDGVEYGIMMNYDRFRGGRLIGNEVHGGATLEEGLVPIIKLSLSDDNESIMFSIEKTEIKIKNNQHFDIVVYSSDKIDNVKFNLKTNKGNYKPDNIDYEIINNIGHKYILNFEPLEYNETGHFELQIFSNDNIINNMQVNISRAGITMTNDF